MIKQATPRENYFQINIAKYGENFIHIKSPKDIQKDAKRKLFKDMVFANINYDEYGKYFTDPEFLENLIAVSYSLHREHSTIAYALKSLWATTADPVTEQLANRHWSIAIVFYEIYHELSLVKSQNYDIKYLLYIANNTAQYRNEFSEIY